MKNLKLIVLVSALTAFVPLSNDLYLPALPQMMAYFSTTELVLNTTLSIFYLFMALGMILVGPLSDKMGRRALLLPSIVIYTFSSFLSALSPHVGVLIALRAVQATAVGCIIAVSIAMVSDGFEGSLRERVLGITGAMSLISPMIAPVLGAVLLSFFDWQAEFVALGVFGVVSFLLAVVQEETLPRDKRITGSPLAALGNVGSLVKDRNFCALMIITGLTPVGYMAFISSSSYLYQFYFGFSEMMYGIIYGLNAIAAILATLFSYRIRAALGGRHMMWLFLLVMACSGVAIMVFGRLSALVFFVLFLPFAFCCTGSKPVAFSMLLRQKEGEAGAASSLVNFVHTLTSCVGLVLGSIMWGDIVIGLGAVVTLFGTAAVVGWWVIMRSPKTHILSFEDEERALR